MSDVQDPREDGAVAEQERPEQRPTLPPEGWFDDPEWPGWLRWWDGERWTEHRTRDPKTVPSARRDQGTSNWAIAALVTGALGIVFVAILCGVVARRRIKESDGRLGGLGMANAGIALGIAYGIGFVVLLAAGAFQGHQNDAGRFQGAERQVAQVVDTFERAVDKNEGDRVCADLLTARFAAKVAEGAGQTCPEAVKDAVASGAYQAEIDVKSIDISGDVASIAVTEGDDREQWTLRRIAGVWRIDTIKPL